MEGIKMTPIDVVAFRGRPERGKNRRTIRQFLDSGADAVLVEERGANPVILYTSLRRAAMDMGLKDAVYVQKDGDEIKLIRVR